MATSRASDFVVNKVLGIDTNARYATQPTDLDERAREVIEPADIYLEDEPTVKEFLKELVPTKEGAANYVRSVFPSASWIRRYNVRWLLGDVIAGKSDSTLDM